MNLPDKAFLKRGEVVKALGLSQQEFTKLINAGVINPVYLRKDDDGNPLGHARFTRSSIQHFIQEVQGECNNGSE